MGSTDFSFVVSDVERQRQIAGNALAKARELDIQIDKTGDAEAKEALKKARDEFLSIAREIAENANSTSSMATIVFSEVSSRAT